MTSDATPESTRPSLDGRTIAISAVSGAADEIVAALQQGGAQVIICPPVEVAAPKDFSRLNEAIEHLYGYDWLVFTNPDAVDYFLARLSSLNHGASDLDEIKVYAIDVTTAERLRERRVHVDVIPESYKSNDCLRALQSFVGGEDVMQGLNILIPCGISMGDRLAKSLEAAGARVDAVTCYQTVLPEGMAAGRFAAILSAGVDCLVVMGGGDVENLVRIFDAPDLSRTLQGIAVVCFDEATAESARQHGLTVQIRRPGNIVMSVAAAIDDSARERM